MTTFHFLTPASPTGLLSSGDAQRVADVLRRGGLAVLPTETGYMLAAMATSVEAVSRAFTAKQRDVGNPMHVACSSLSMARQVGRISPLAQRLIAELTPGPLTVVVPQTAVLPTTLVTLNGTVGLRIPDSPATLQVVAALGAPVTATSVNKSGEESIALTRAGLMELEWNGLSEVPVVEHTGAVMYMSPSTLVRLTGSELEVLRPGPVTEEDMEQAMTSGSAQAIDESAQEVTTAAAG